MCEENVSTEPEFEALYCCDSNDVGGNNCEGDCTSTFNQPGISAMGACTYYHGISDCGQTTHLGEDQRDKILIYQDSNIDEDDVCVFDFTYDATQVNYVTLKGLEELATDAEIEVYV